jgi:protease-4
VRRFRQNTDKKVIAMCMDVAASGGYYVACAADQIVAQPTGVVGSIGVVVLLPDLHGLMDKVGVDVHVVKSGRMKDAGSPFRLLEPDEREYFQTMVNDLFERFVAVVDEGRPQLDTEQVRALADGRVFTANQALENGLVDRVGTLRDALAIAREAAGLKQAHVVMYHRPLAWTPTIYAQAQTPPNQPSQSLLGIDVIGWWHRMRSPFLYLWCPGM